MLVLLWIKKRSKVLHPSLNLNESWVSFDTLHYWSMKMGNRHGNMTKIQLSFWIARSHNIEHDRILCYRKLAQIKRIKKTITCFFFLLHTNYYSIDYELQWCVVLLSSSGTIKAVSMKTANSHKALKKSLQFIRGYKQKRCSLLISNKTSVHVPKNIFQCEIC